jgi:superoxide dismutase, Fe-Mn family
MYMSMLNTAGLDEQEQHIAQSLLDKFYYNVSGHILHLLYWNSITSAETKLPSGSLKNIICNQFGSIRSFQDVLRATACSIEDAGWLLLKYDEASARLMIEHIHDNNLLGIDPEEILLALDLWEHAYSLDYKNDKSAYVDSFVKKIDWLEMSNRFNLLQSA